MVSNAIQCGFESRPGYQFRNRRSKVEAIQYIWGTMWGTTMVDCSVINKRGDSYLIEFYDDIAEEKVRRTAERDELVFPSFANRVLC